MKTKIKLLIILMAVFAISLIAGIAAGCNIGVDTQQDAADKAGMTARVTYYANGGTFSDNSICYKTMSFAPGAPIFNIGVDKVPAGRQNLTITRTNFTLVGWAEAELDADGLPLLYEMDNDGNLLANKPLDYKDNGSAEIVSSEDNKEMSEQSKSFTAKVPDNMDLVFEGGNPKLEDKQHLFLVAIWAPDIVLDYVLVADEPVSFYVPNEDDPETEEDESLTEREVEFNTGDVIASAPFGLDGEVVLNPKTAPKTPASDHSFIYLYWDEECTQPVDATGAKVPYPENEENAVIYAKYIPGRWTAVGTASDARGIFTSTSQFYIVRDIDCADETFNLRSSYFNGRIEGNGHTLSNLNFTYSGTLGNEAIISMFGRIGDSAVIKDITFENVTLTAEVTFNRTAYIYALFNECAEGAQFENFSVEGLTMSISRRNDTAIIGNIEYSEENGEYITTNWLYGGAVLDENFTEANGSIIKNATLIINDEIIVQEDSNE